VRRFLRWIALAATIGVLALALAGINAPSPPLFAGLLGALAYTLLASTPIVMPRPVFIVAQAAIGTVVAAQVDTDALKAFGDDWSAILLVTLATLAVSAIAGQLLLLHGVSRPTATFSSIAGGASGMTAIAEDLGADSRVVTVIQYLRVLVILLTLPALVTLAFGPDRHGVPSLSGGSPRITDYLFLVVAVTLGIGFGRVARLPSPALLGSMLVGIAFVLTPTFDDAAVPTWIQAAAFVLIGMQVGLRFTKQSLVAIGRMVPTALLMIMIVIATCAGLGVLLSAMTGESELDSYLATTPGGLPAVLATSTETSGNVTFVTSVQLMRLILVLVLAPFVARFLLRGDEPT
jgi:membrane AbrB-like protein